MPKRINKTKTCTACREERPEPDDTLCYSCRIVADFGGDNNTSDIVEYLDLPVPEASEAF